MNKSFIRNKAAQLFSLAFVTDFPSRWASFVNDLLGSLSAGEAAVDIYLRIMMAIDSEVVAREIAHTPEVHSATRDCVFVFVEIRNWTHEMNIPCTSCAFGNKALDFRVRTSMYM